MVNLQQGREHINADLAGVLEQLALPEPLLGAVRHAVLLGGKRIRPLLVYAAQTALDGRPLPTLAARRAAVAVELIHCYSLVHDDLPCMDDDALRRGQPTCHVVYGEATALLAADVLQSLAFEVLSGGCPLPGQPAQAEDAADWRVQRDQVCVLSQRASRMVAGQVLDLEAEGRQVDEATLAHIHRHKTGALIEAAVLMGARAAGWGLESPQLRVLAGFAQALGLAFQVQDDILDVTASTEQLGKPAGSDLKLQKSTYPALLGLEGARQRAAALHGQALAAVLTLEQQSRRSAMLLRELLDALLGRKS